jgi:hypothetical protein
MYSLSICSCRGYCCSPRGGLHRFLGYLWLLVACLYFLLRCLYDLVLVRRPALGNNLDFAGLAWMAGALYIGLVAVAAREPSRGSTPRGESTTGTDDVRKGVQKVIGPYAPPGVDDSRLRLWAERSLSLLCHLSVVVGLVLIGWRHFQDVQAGMAAATFYLLLPYTYLLLPDSALGVGRWDHAWPMALMVWTVFCYRRPILAAAFLGVASGTAFFLVLILPVWLSFYRHRGAMRFLCSFVLSAGLGAGGLGRAVCCSTANCPAVCNPAGRPQLGNPGSDPTQTHRAFGKPGPMPGRPTGTLPIAFPSSSLR